MDNDQTDPDSAWKMAQLAQALNQMRDAWTQAALLLRDIQFEEDTAQRQAVMDHVDDMMKKLK